MYDREKLVQSAESLALHLVSNAAIGIAYRRPDFLMRALEPMLNRFPAGFYCTEIETGKIIYANRTFLQIIGHENVQAVNGSMVKNELYKDPGQRAEWLKILQDNGDNLQQYRLTLLKKVSDEVCMPVCVEDSAFLVPRMDGKPRHVVGFIQDVTEKVKMEKKLEEKVYLDALTLLNNRGYYEDKLETDLNRWRAEGKSVSVIMIDIDHFKRWNDELPNKHTDGDKILRELGLLFRTRLKQEDIPIRYGGEEILIALPVDKEIAKKVAERLRRLVESLGKLPERRILRDGKTLTISLGVSSGDGSLKELTCEADAALYASKDKGRNRVTVYEEGMKKE